MGKLGDPTIIDIETYLNGNPMPLEDIDRYARFGECPHKSVVLDEQAHTVICKTCEKVLDPFWYLQLLAREWKTRAYVDARQRERYDKLMEARRNAEARGKVFEQPTSGVGREAWDVFTQAFAKGGTTLSYMYRRGSEWYGANGVDAHYGLFYARGVLAGAYEASA